jgi:TRAP-type uncharacterized transport system substrate-binding protein
MVQHVHAILGALGISFSDFVPVYLDFSAGAEALARGEVDAQFQCPIPNKVMTDLAARIAVRVVRYRPGQIMKVISAVPLYRSTIMPRHAIRGLERDLAQLAVVNVLVTHARIPAPVVREVVVAVIAGSDELPRLNPLFAGLADLLMPMRTEGASALELGGVPVHEGALQAYREAGLL